ncbi:hypothetical protein F2P79_016757, partial [Pimephales promelas]
TSPSRSRHEPLSTEGARTLTSRRETREAQAQAQSKRAYETAPIITTTTTTTTTPRPRSPNNGSIQRLMHRWRHAGADEWSFKTPSSQMER